jgi:hypothetical protein
MIVGIIGTAGRGDDYAKLSYDLYQNCGKKILNLVKEFDVDGLVSGGAAWMDHLAVSIFLKSQIKLKLHFPTNFEFNPLGYVEKGGKLDSGSVANYYHNRFSQILGRNSLQDIAKALIRNAEFEVTQGFKERNTKVAEDADILIAATFGEGEKLKSGGTLDTWNKFAKLKPTNKKFHIDLHTNQLYPL